jgi:hypothetical protein
MSTDQGERKNDPSSGSKTDPTAVILYKAPTTTPIPTFFGGEPRIIDISGADAPAGADETKEPPAMPRAARLGEAPHVASQTGPAASTPGKAEDAAPRPDMIGRGAARSGRFALLAASVSFAACLGAVGGALGYAQLQHPAATSAPIARVDANEDIRALKDTVAQLRANVKTLGDTMAAMRTASTASNANVSAQLGKVTETLDRVERGERRAAVAAPPAAAPETTGSTAGHNAVEPKASAKPAVVEGWVVRKIYDGAALVEGRYGMVEVEPGMILPGVGRVHEIKRQDGRWVVVTAKGLIMPVHP